LNSSGGGKHAFGAEEKDGDDNEKRIILELAIIMAMLVKKHDIATYFKPDLPSSRYAFTSRCKCSETIFQPLETTKDNPAQFKPNTTKKKKKNTTKRSSRNKTRVPTTTGYAFASDAQPCFWQFLYAFNLMSSMAAASARACFSMKSAYIAQSSMLSLQRPLARVSSATPREINEEDPPEDMEAAATGSFLKSTSNTSTSMPSLP
jgi:hypothetical protein